MLRNICLVLICLLVPLIFYQPIEIADVGWHIATGQWILKHQQIPHEDPFAISSEPGHWVFTQWLGSTLLSIPYLVGGPQALKIFRDFIFILTIVIFLIYARRKIPDALAFSVAILMVYGLTTRCLARSFIFNFIFISIILIILFSFQKNKSVKQLYILPIMALIWGNIHLGSFVYGAFILSIFLLSTVLNSLKELKQTTNKVIKQDLLKLITQVVTMCVLYFLCVGITPYGIEGFLYPYKVFLIPDYINFYKFTFSVSENMSPSYIFTLSGSWFVGLLLLTLATLIIGKKRDLFSILLFVVALFLFLAFSRGSDFFAIVCGYIIVDQVCSGIVKEKLPIWFWKLQLSGWTYSILILIISFQLINTINKKAYINGHERRILTLDYLADHPKESVDFLKDLGITGNIFCNEHIGSYIVGAEYPLLKTLVDGRQVNQEYFYDYFQTTGDPAKYWKGMEKKYQFKIVLLDAALPISLKLMHYLNEDVDWQIINVDNTYVTFIKKGAFPLPAVVDSFKTTLMTTQATAQEHAEIMNLALDKKFQKNFFYLSQFIDVLEEGVTLMELGYTEAAVKKFTQSLKVDPIRTKQSLHIQIAK